jgi:NADPH2:quinone reductase
VQALLGWYAAGKLKPHVSHRLPLDRAVEGIRLLTDRRALGKVVVTLGS